MESSAALWVSGEATAFFLPIAAFRELHLCGTEIAFVFFRGGVAVADSPDAVAVAAASVERITAVAGTAVVSLYAAPLEGAAVADAAAIALAAAAPVVGAAVAVADALTMTAAAPAEGAAVAKAAVEGPDPGALFLSLSQASLLSLLYCCLFALGGRFFVFLSAAVVSLHLEVGQCAADAAFRAVQLKVAIPRWLRLHQREGLYQEEKITARISGRSHLIKENEAKNYNSLVGVNAARWLPKPSPLPQVAERRVKTAGLPSPPPHVGTRHNDLPGTRKGPATTRHLSHD